MWDKYLKLLATFTVGSADFFTFAVNTLIRLNSQMKKFIEWASLPRIHSNNRHDTTLPDMISEINNSNSSFSGLSPPEEVTVGIPQEVHNHNYH